MTESVPETFVGRTGELDSLRVLLAQARAGSPSLALITGETGVGKTRLVRELIAAESPVVLGGACVPMAGDPLPYGPLRQGLRRLAGHGVVRQDMARYPVLARLGPGSTEDADAGDPANPAVLFYAVLELLAHLGATGPVLHVVEDLHWADRSTLDLLRYLAVNLTGERAMIVGTFRDDAILPGSQLAGWLAEVGRLEVTHRLELERLNPKDASRLAAELSDGHPDPTLLASAVTRSAGNPLFLEQLVHYGVTDGLPTTLREVLASRVESLPGPTREVLRAMAVLGRPVDIDLAVATSGGTLAAVEDAARQAVERHILEVRPDGRLALRHPAFGEVVYAELLPGERRRLHRAAAHAITAAGVERRGELDADAGELARHWLQAGDRDRGLDAAVEAGRMAERMYAFADAHAWFARAAELTADVTTAHDPMRLLSQAAEAASLSGDTAAAVRLGQEALALAASASDRADLCERLGTYEYLAGRGGEADRWYRQALATLPDGPPTTLTARVYAGLAMFAAAWSRLDEAVDLGRLGMVIARETGARRAEGRLHNALGLALAVGGDTEDGIAHLREALTIAREVRSAHDLGSAYVNLSHVQSLACRWADVVDTSRAGMAALEEVGLAQQRGSILRANTCEALISLGRLAEATELLRDPRVPPARGIMAAPGLQQQARVAALSGDLREAWDRCSAARMLIEAEGAPDSWMRTGYELSALIELWANRPAAAHEQVIEGLRLVVGGDEERFGAHLAVLGMWALADQAEAHRHTASRRRLAEQIDPLAAALQRAADRPDAAAYRAWFAAERARLSRRSDPALWEAAVREWDLASHPVRALYARWRAVEARLDRGVDAAAVDALRDARQRASAMGVVRIGDELDRLAHWHHLDLPSAATEPASGEDPVRQEYGLTDRELEVLRALAAGRTNREIAQELFISAKTASVHVSNILRKLDVSGRQEAARVAHRLGLRG